MIRSHSVSSVVIANLRFSFSSCHGYFVMFSYYFRTSRLRDFDLFVTTILTSVSLFFSFDIIPVKTATFLDSTFSSFLFCFQLSLFTLTFHLILTTLLREKLLIPVDIAHKLTCQHNPRKIPCRGYRSAFMQLVSLLDI